MERDFNIIITTKNSDNKVLYSHGHQLYHHVTSHVQVGESMSLHFNYVLCIQLQIPTHTINHNNIYS